MVNNASYVAVCPAAWFGGGTVPVSFSAACTPKTAPAASPATTALTSTAFTARRRRARRSTRPGMSGPSRISSAFRSSRSLMSLFTSLTPGHVLAEPLDPSGHERLHRSDRALHRVGRLGFRQVLVVAEDDRRPLSFRQAQQRLPHLLARSDVRPDRAGSAGLPFQVGALHAGPAEVRSGEVDHGLAEVRPERVG